MSLEIGDNSFAARTWGGGEQEPSQRWPELTPSQDDVMDGSSEDLQDYSTDEIDDSSVTLDDKASNKPGPS